MRTPARGRATKRASLPYRSVAGWATSEWLCRRGDHTRSTPLRRRTSPSSATKIRLARIRRGWVGGPMRSAGGGQCGHDRTPLREDTMALWWHMNNNNKGLRRHSVAPQRCPKVSYVSAGRSPDRPQQTVERGLTSAYVSPTLAIDVSEGDVHCSSRPRRPAATSALVRHQADDRLDVLLLGGRLLLAARISERVEISTDGNDLDDWSCHAR